MSARRRCAVSASKPAKSRRCAQSVAKLNGRHCTSPSSRTGQPPNDLLDQRDAAHRPAVAEQGRPSTVVAEGRSALNVFIGNGQPLVLGTTARRRSSTTVRSARSGTHAASPCSTARGHGRHHRVDVRRHARRPARLAPARCWTRRATNSAASASRSRRQVQCAASRGHGLLPARWAATSSTSARVGVRRLPRTPQTGTLPTVTRTNVGALTANDYVLLAHCGAMAYTLRRRTRRMQTSSNSRHRGLSIRLSSTAVVHRGRAGRHRRSVRHSSDPRCHHGGLVRHRSRSRHAAARRSARRAASNNLALARSLRRSASTDATRGCPEHERHRCSPRRPPIQVNGGRKRRVRRGPIDVNGWRVAISGAPAQWRSRCSVARTTPGQIGQQS